ncbi:hypothetical protein F4810DRAFT_64536 [Camillea tinctor]|nr:hypothetical protein F4810DRAFT_64536 [Camillea tinctor]
MIYWDEICERTVDQILELGFEIQYIREGTSLAIGEELRTGAHLLVTAGDKAVGALKHTAPGISEGLRNMAHNGLNGVMVIYGLKFQFVETDFKRDVRN